MAPDQGDSYFNVAPRRQAGHKAVAPRVIKNAVQHDSQRSRVHLLQANTQDLRVTLARQKSRQSEGALRTR